MMFIYIYIRLCENSFIAHLHRLFFETACVPNVCNYFSHRHYIIDNQAANNRGGVFSEMVAVETRLCNAGAPSCLE